MINSINQGNKPQCHHIIPVSKGGTDDYVEFKSEYEHAYDHAIDFLLFDISPVFDCRHKGWPYLPTDLQEAVRDKLREIWNSRQSWKGLLGGAKIRDEKLGICSEGFGERVSEKMKDLVSRGEHWFQDPKHSEITIARNKEPQICPICQKVIKGRGPLGVHIKACHLEEVKEKVLEEYIHPGQEKSVGNEAELSKKYRISKSTILKIVSKEKNESN